MHQTSKRPEKRATVQPEADARKAMLADRRKEQRERKSTFMWPWTKNSDPAYRKN